MELPIIRQSYNYFDDGKISHSRKIPVVIKAIIPLNKAKKEIIKLWEEEFGEMGGLYLEETDYFIKADLRISSKENIEIIFVRASHNRWFSLGWWAGVLDLDGSLARSLPKPKPKI